MDDHKSQVLWPDTYDRGHTMSGTWFRTTEHTCQEGHKKNLPNLSDSLQMVADDAYIDEAVS